MTLPHRVGKTGLIGEPGEDRGGARREEQCEIDNAGGERPHRRRAQRRDRPRLVEHGAIHRKAASAQFAGQIAGDEAAGDMQQPARLRPQAPAHQLDQIADRAAGAMHIAKAFRPRPRRGCLADGEQRQGALRG